jgi:hypothetical protein
MTILAIDALAEVTAVSTTGEALTVGFDTLRSRALAA